MSEERARAALDDAGIDYTIARHGPVRSLVEAAEARGVAPKQVVKTLWSESRRVRKRGQPRREIESAG